jgi:NAD-dependent histone deacetylase SIR2
MCNIVRDRKDGVTVWLNNDPEPVGKDLEDKWDLVVKGPCDEVARYANMRRRDDLMLNKEAPNTPSKKGTKRKADAHMNSFAKVATKAQARKPKAQPKRTTATSKIKVKKEPKREAPAIDSVFKTMKKRDHDRSYRKKG